ncbi:MAG: nitroreductase family protein [Eubacteriales bacterium]|nr:nitroreductase family protein [Eubacteriales bacterium]
MDAIFHRTSIRKFTEQAVEDSKVKMLLRAAMAAPSAQNQQPWEMYVVKNRNTLNELAECSPYAGMLRRAPLGIVMCCRKDCRSPEYAQIDCSAATENLLLEADTLGLGAVWIGIAPREERMAAAKKVLGLPEHLYAFCFIACGYPAEQKKQQDRYDETRIHYVP